MFVRGIRGATTIEKDCSENIDKATRELLRIIISDNQIALNDIASVIFSTTHDISSAYPAKAARMMGWDNVPFFCCQEMEVLGSLPYCIRVLIHVNTDKTQNEIKHVYLHEARKLREDLQKKDLG